MNEPDQDVSIFALVTFPGVMIHEFGHKLFCDLLNVKVIQSCYFRFGDPLGYVIHEKPKYYIQTFFISIGPFIIGTALSLGFFLLAVHISDILKYFFGWLAISIAIHVFPSSTDTSVLWYTTNEKIGLNPARNFYLFLFYPIILLMYITSTRLRLIFIIYYPIMLYKITLWVSSYLPHISEVTVY